MGVRPPDERMLPFAQTDNPLELVNAYVSRKRRKQGVGTALIKKLEEFALAQGATEIFLNSGPRYRKSGWEFYDKVGYKRVALAEGYYQDEEGSYDAPVWSKVLSNNPS